MTHTLAPKKKKKAGARYYLTKTSKEPKIQGYWKHSETKGIWKARWRKPSYWETGIPSKLSKWALEGPKAGQFQEGGSQVSALPFGWDVVLARTWLGCVSKLRKT